MLIVNGKDLSILIELKGSDLDKAFRQLATSNAALTEHLKRHKKWIIVYSGRPRFNSTEQKMILEARRNHDSSLLVRSTVFRFAL